MSSVVLTCGPSAVITRNLVSGSLSPTWIAIVVSPCKGRRVFRAFYGAGKRGCRGEPLTTAPVPDPHPEERRQPRLEGVRPQWALMVRDGASAPPHHEGRAAYAAAFFSSRSSRRRIFPTLV